jgi:branched-chain amino acid:cation transporter, LIVCS family
MQKGYFMKFYFNTKTISIGLAMFSMFFGAGNIIYPLAVGQVTGDKNLFGMIGLILTAAIMPIAGVIGMILFDGNYRDFFGRLGRIPGFLLAFAIISLLGPLGSTPRCIALSYSTLKPFLWDLSPTAFSAIACLIILFCTINKRYILTILGLYLTPILLSTLGLIIAIGLWTASPAQTIPESNFNVFLYGLKEGYNTMDLLAAFFFSSTIVNILRSSSDKKNSQQYLTTAFRASLIGALLLALVYVGFSYLASFHAQDLSDKNQDELLTAITLKIAGSYGGALACITIAMACLTTAIALISSFTDFVQKEVFKEKIRYEILLIASLLITFFVSTFEFTGIATFLGPVLQVFYPGLIVLTFLNIAYRLKNIKPIKVPVFAAFTLSTLVKLASF